MIDCQICGQAIVSPPPGARPMPPGSTGAMEGASVF